MTFKPYHPAKYQDGFIQLFASLLRKYKVEESVLDPLAGTGKIGLLREYGFQGRIVANELEPEWAYQAPDHVEVHVGDATCMDWAQDEEFEAIVTSPVYGNRMSDHFEAKDSSRRYTYRHALGRALHPNNTGRLHWGPKYQEAHRRIWTECIRVLKPGGIMILNVKNFYRNGVMVEVSEWHAEELQRQGLRLLERLKVGVPGMRYGANSQFRVETEDIWVFQKPF